MQETYPRRKVEGEHYAAMTADEFRRIALSLPEATESAHMGHPDFRVGGKIYATLGYPSGGVGVIMLTPDEQEHFVKIQPAAFAPVKGGWGLRGATQVRLGPAKKAVVREALKYAWQHRAPKRLTARQ